MKHSIIVLLAALAGCVQPGLEKKSQPPQACANPPAVRRDIDRVRDVIAKRIALGMTTCEVLAVWGMPDDVSERESLGGKAHTTYVYMNRPGSSGAVVRFYNGRVESIQ